MRRPLLLLILTLSCRFLLPVLPFVAEAATNTTTNTSLQHIRLQLKWLHQFQFAGLYAAIHQGYFRDAGLDVELIEGGPEIDPAEVVTRGQAEFGIGNSSLLVDFHNGRPVVAVAAIFQHSPFVILARKDRNLNTIRDLEGRTLMTEVHSAEVTAFLKKSGVDLNAIRFVPHTGNIHSLSNQAPRRVDATTAYLTTEPFAAYQAKIPYQIFNPRDVEIDFYGDTLFTSKEFARQNPQLVAKMREAVIAGWQYAQGHQEEMIDLIQRQYHSKLDRLALGFEAQSIYNLMRGGVIEIGYMSASRWQHIGNLFAEAGLLPKNFSIDGFLFEDEKKLPAWAQRILLWGSIALLVIGLVSGYILRLNRKLSSSVQTLALRTEQLEQLNRRLTQLSATDALTGLANRRRLDEALEQALTHAVHSHTPLSLIFLDVDYFKHYNDKLGHLAGDQCLQRIALVLQEHAQETGYLAARFGGEEFALIAPDTDAAHAHNLAQRICTAVCNQAIQHPDSPYGYLTVSIGLATWASDLPPLTTKELLCATDGALYRAKQQGRNRVCVADL